MQPSGVSLRTVLHLVLDFTGPDVILWMAAKEEKGV